MCLGSFLYLVEMIVRTNRVSWEDFRRSFGMYLWDVVAVSFALWIFWQVVTPLLQQVPQGHVIVLCIELLILVLFNAVPELIYLGHYPLLQLLSRSYEFIASNWIEWFPPNLLLMAVFVALWAYGAGGHGGAGRPDAPRRRCSSTSPWSCAACCSSSSTAARGARGSSATRWAGDVVAPACCGAPAARLSRRLEPSAAQQPARYQRARRRAGGAAGAGCGR